MSNGSGAAEAALSGAPVKADAGERRALALASMREQVLATLSAWAARILPPLIMLALCLLIWEVLCSKAGSSLPAPSKIWTEARDLITDPFFVAGPQDIGLGWRVLAVLQRVAIRLRLAASPGIALGTVIGQSVWAMRGLDPLFQVLAHDAAAGLAAAALAAFRDAQPSAIFVIFITSIWPIIINTAVGIRNIPQDYRNVASGTSAQSAGILL